MKTIIASLLILLVSACGWHLRGGSSGINSSSELLNIIIETTDDHSFFINELREALPSYQLKETEQLKEDQKSSSGILVLDLGKETLDRRTAGVGSDALTSAYEIILRVDYTLSKNGVFLTTQNNSARLSRTYNYNVNNANSAEREEELVLREMRQELAQNILRRIRNLAVKKSD